MTTPHFPIYLDYGATNPCDPRVVDAIVPWLREHFGNPASRSHAWGWEAEAAVEKAREYVAELIGADPREIVWTSGATESNNLAIKGVARFYAAAGKKHVVTTQTEHKCVLDSCRALEQDGFRVTYLPVRSDGLIDMAQLEAAITPDTALVSVMGVNNEIGVIQPLAEIGALCRARKVFFHTDAAQVRVCAGKSWRALVSAWARQCVPASLSPAPPIPTPPPTPSPLPPSTAACRCWARCRWTWMPRAST